LRDLSQVPSNLPDSLSPLVLEQSIQQAFVEAVHTMLLMAGLTLSAGIGLILLFTMTKLKPQSIA
jgi:hypothetical protein